MALTITEYDFDNGLTNNFVTSLKNQFKKFGAKNFEVSLGYYYLSGFFTVNEQYYYFSIPDVRWSDNKLLVRTAKHNKDYTGGANNFFEIKSGLGNKIARQFRFDVKTTTSNKKTPTQLAQEAFTNKSFSKVVTSGAQAASIIFRLIDLFDYRGTVTESKYGRYLSAVKHSSKYFDAYYSHDTKRLNITFNEK